MDRIKVNPYVYEVRVGDISFEGCISKTKQSFSNECDINKIMTKVLKTGMLADSVGISSRQAIFADVADIGDYRLVMDKIAKANQAFDSLSAEVKNRFNNDPALLVEFMKDSGNLEEACKLGLLPMKIWEDKVAADTAASAAAEAAARAAAGSAAGTPAK